MKKFILIIIVCAVTIPTFSQAREDKKEKKEARRQKVSELIRQSEEGVLVYQKQSIFGIQLRSNGYGAFYELGRMKTNRKTTTYRIDINEVKDKKEEKGSGSNSFFGNSFIYGKINYFYPVTLGFGQQYILGQKGNKNGVAVTAIYNAGLSIGLLRPYYLNVQDPNNPSGQVAIKYQGADSTTFLDANSIISGGGFGKGWSELKIKPGAFAKVAMRFDYGRFNETVSAIEVGLSVDGYASKIPILALNEGKRIFFQGYVAILFGRRK